MGKNPNESNPQIPSSNSPPSSNNIIFKSNDQSSSVSSNLTQTLQQVLQLDIDSPLKTQTRIPNSSIERPTNRKRKDYNNNNNIESHGFSVKKSKIESGSIENYNNNIERHDFEVKKSKIESGSIENNDNNNQKKRKRGEIEAEYEERKLGGLELDNVKDEGVKVKIGGKRKEVEKEELVAKEGFDDEEKLLRTVFVGNLPLKVTKKVLLREFQQFGEVESVRIRSVPLLDDKTPRKGGVIKKQMNDVVDRVNAYIVFKTKDSAQAALSHNMAVVGGNHIHVDRACPPRKKLKGENAPPYDTKRTVFIGNLPFDVKDEELYQLFTGYSKLKDCIEAIRVVRDPGTRMGNGIAYVLFTTREAANMVVRKHKLKIRDRELRLSHAMKPSSNSTPSKRKEPPTPDGYSSFKKAAVGGTELGSENAVKQKVRSEKRPVVAARKEAANTSRTGGDGDGGGVKRKAESRTPQNDSRNKKHRKF
ncbi:uncharacterized protein LOC143554632 [Bidens hawaiensis]|uniref:uncharacterized protein LOC143554632 n=1 Tax=Bidens hawaiensis TaxID=980011 RepID=UPI00404A7483